MSARDSDRILEIYPLALQAWNHYVKQWQTDLQRIGKKFDQGSDSFKIREAQYFNDWLAGYMAAENNIVRAHFNNMGYFDFVRQVIKQAEK